MILKTIWKEFIYGGHLQSLGTLSIILSSAVLLKIKISWDIFLVVYLMLYPIYSFNRLKEIEIDSLTNPERSNYLKTYLRRMPQISYSLILIFILAIFYFSGLTSLIAGILFLTLGLLYTTFFKKLTQKIFLFKNFYVAAFFASMVIFMLIYYSQPITTAALALMALIFLKGMVMQISLDIKDIAGDAKVGLKTLAVVFGKEKTLIVLKMLAIFTVLPILIFSLYFNVLPKLILLLILTLPFNFYYFSLAKQQKYSAYFLAGSEFILWSILILVGEIIL